MLGIMSYLILCCLMVIFMTPMKMALSLTLVSIIMAFSTYSSCGSSFPSSALVISFSSGMMVVFCYAASMVNFESKNNNMSMSLIVCAFTMLSTTTEKMEPTKTMEILNIFISSNTLMLLMLMVILSMKAINKAIFNPTKTMMMSY